MKAMNQIGAQEHVSHKLSPITYWPLGLRYVHPTVLTGLPPPPPASSSLPCETCGSTTCLTATVHVRVGGWAHHHRPNSDLDDGHLVLPGLVFSGGPPHTVYTGELFGT